MTFGQKLAWDDTVLPFQLDASDIRGRVARLDGVLDGILKQHNYPLQVEALVAEMALLTALIGQTMKLRWKLSLQVQSEGPVRMIATDYYAPEAEGEAARIRAYASYDADRLTDGGAMDQLAAVYGREGHALLIDCRTLEVEPVPLGLERGPVALVVVDSGVRRKLTDSSYNQRRRECARAATAIGVADLRDVTPDQLQAREPDLPPALYRRARHVVNEQDRVAAAVDALRHDEFEALGRLLCESHSSLRDDFQVSCPELDLLVELASGVEGVLGARLMGAGFGGSTLTLLRESALDAFRRDVVKTYRKRTGLLAEMYVVRPGAGLRVTDV